MEHKVSDTTLCICGHAADVHFNYNGCLVDKLDNSLKWRDWKDHCPCNKFEAANDQQPNQVVPSGVHIQTILSDDGEARILFEFNEVSIQFTQDACADIALHLLAAVHASRAEQALYKYAMEHSIDPQQLVKFMR